MSLDPGPNSPEPTPRPPGGLRAALDRFRNRLDSWAEQNPEAMARIALSFGDPAPEGPGEGVLGIGRSIFERVAPPNWRQLKVGMTVQADRLMRETGICLVWVPPAEVLGELISAADKAERNLVLRAHATAIVDSVELVLGDVSHPELAALREHAEEALATWRSGHHAAAQALASAIITGIVEDHYGFTFGRARQAFEREDPATAGFWSHRRALVQCALHAAIIRSESRPPGAGFNRHITSHGSDLSHFSVPHAIEALMLMGGALRELNETYRLSELGFTAAPGIATYAAAHRSRLIAVSGVDR